MKRVFFGISLLGGSTSHGMDSNNLGSLNNVNNSQLDMASLQHQIEQLNLQLRQQRVEVAAMQDMNASDYKEELQQLDKILRKHTNPDEVPIEKQLKIIRLRLAFLRLRNAHKPSSSPLPTADTLQDTDNPPSSP